MKRTEQSPLRRFFASRAFLVAMLGITVFIAFGFARAYYQDYEVRQEIKKLEDEANKLEKKKIESMSILNYVMSSSYVEDKARTELNMKKPDEHVVFIKDLSADTGEDTRTNTSSPVDGQPLSNLAKWWYYFTTHSLPQN